ncbi:MAG TPA: SIMPL domain-containing protein [Phenylobacterium sp.]
MKTFLRAAGFGLLLAGAAAPAAFAQAPASASDNLFHATTLNLAAYGEARAAPDMATISLGVTTEGATAAEAMAANARQIGQVLSALKSAGIAARDIQTSGLNLNAQYAYAQGQPPRLTGYQAANQLSVTVHDLSRLGATVDATVNAGANQVNGISFGLNDPTAAENAARLAAVKALAAKADLYARATGYRVSRLVSLSEGGGYAPPPPLPMANFAKRDLAAAASRVEPGELKVRIDVTGLYELAR